MLIIGPLPPPMGGVGALVEAILRSPLRLSWDLDVFNLSKPQQEGKPSTITPWDMAWTLLHLVQLPWRLLTRRPRAVLAQSTADTGFFRDLALILECRAVGVPVVIHWHGAPDSPQFPGTSAWRQRLFRLGVALSSGVIVLGDSYREYFGRFVPAEKLLVLPNFVDGEVFRPADAAPPAGTAPRVLFVGRIGPLKGADVLLDALMAARERVPGLTATLIGAGETGAAFAEAAAHPAVTSGVARLTGPLGPERVDEYRAAQIFAQPTRMDSFPVAVLEAMACGLPVVASSVGAIPWMLDEGACGELVAPGDTAALTEALVRFGGDPALRARLGAAGRARQQARFDGKVAAATLDRALARAVGRA